MKKIMKALVLVIALCLVLTGCQYLPEIPGLNQNPEHVHTLIHNEAKAPTCVNNGILEHWYCPGCNARFSDEAATIEVTFADLEVEENGHVAAMDDGDCTTAVMCTVCDGVAVKAKAHTPEDDDGDCTTNVMCSECVKVAIPGAEAHTPGAEATCTENQVCTVCDTVLVEAGHTWTDAEGKDATCTEDGYTAHKVCACGETEGKETVPATGHTWTDAEGKDATCTEDGYTAHKVCACGETEGKETVPATGKHIDENLDITCDYEGCSKRILPAADSKVSLFTANHMIIVSLSSNYYVEGVVTEVTDAKNGIFVITDEAGDTILVRLPKNADGVSYASWTVNKVIVGDTVQVYGKPTKNTGTPTAQAAKVEGGVLTVLKHEHTFSEATCTNVSTCLCGATTGEKLDHNYIDGICSSCGFVKGAIVANKTMTELIAANGWTSSTTKQSFKLDDVVSVKINGGSNTGKAYNGNHIRIYATDSPAGTITISVAEGYELVSIKISAATGTYASLYVDGTTTDICNVSTSVSGNSVLLKSVKNGSNGKQVRVTGIEVVYKAVTAE